MEMTAFIQQESWKQVCRQKFHSVSDPREPVLNVQLWKSYADEIEISLVTPSGERIGPLSEQIGTQRYQAGETELLIYYGKPGPFQVTQEIYFDFIPRGAYITGGVWKIQLRGRRIKDGSYQLWLPGGRVLNPATGFYYPKAEETLTIPSTAAKVITVGAYDSRLNAPGRFFRKRRGQPFLSKAGSGCAGSGNYSAGSRRRIWNRNRNFVCCAFCYRLGSACDGVGDR